MGNFQHQKKSRDEGPEEEGFRYRALAAAIAIPLFEVSLFIGICAPRISGRSAYFFSRFRSGCISSIAASPLPFDSYSDFAV
jgi:hypothetical protein